MTRRLALIEHENGTSATWLEPVTDQDYETAHTGLQATDAAKDTP